MTTVRILSDSVPDLDWIRQAELDGAAIVAGQCARLDLIAQHDAEAEQLVVTAAPGHGEYWKVANSICDCAACCEAWRRASERYRRTGSYRAGR